MIKIKRDDPSHSHGKYEVKLRPMPWENNWDRSFMSDTDWPYMKLRCLGFLDLYKNSNSPYFSLGENNIIIYYIF